MLENVHEFFYFKKSQNFIFLAIAFGAEARNLVPQRVCFQTFGNHDIFMKDGNL